jgi:hypothetical protein
VPTLVLYAIPIFVCARSPVTLAGGALKKEISARKNVKITPTVPCPRVHRAKFNRANVSHVMRAGLVPTVLKSVQETVPHPPFPLVCKATDLVMDATRHFTVQRAI